MCCQLNAYVKPPTTIHTAVRMFGIRAGGITTMIVEHDTDALNRPPTNAWNLYLGRGTCGDVQAGLNHEWLVTNGLGGYAAGSIAGATTRSYHGLLVAALRPSVSREIITPQRRVQQIGIFSLITRGISAACVRSMVLLFPI